MKKWEYLVFEQDHGMEGINLAEERMNELGKEGWELAGVQAIQHSRGPYAFLYFKRQLPSDSDV